MRTSIAALLAGGAVATATVLGGRYSPGPQRPATARWYAALDKPSWTPSGATIGTVWSVVNTCLTVAGTRLLIARPSPQRGQALALWGFNVASIWAWQSVFFGARRLGASAAYNAAMIGTGVAYVAAARRVDGLAAAAGVPYPSWVSIAGLLATQIWQRNRNRSLPAMAGRETPLDAVLARKLSPPGPVEATRRLAARVAA
ncbi:Tryptophan-rich sensory protein [Rhodovastum atsumiense]|uniref:Tryptophan-rich sensory protein n=1 Tax=Rhodovastum atsumiense TaxID=504468 RepID=A0A5M6IUC6_9PROT|nr:TspO/MBR family protein [Rhodovastum atsumiense]KAA5611467.1 tryptophan-rich sensory protein [Rhodovastum atsumiense]CAH2601155.1 Tryptophan-rich sensory protein [Rhodovastum atsumiense]